MKVLFFALTTFAVLATTAAAGDKVSGTFSFDDDHCKGLGKGQHCNMAFQIDGDAAKALYENMKDKGVHEECTGGTEKSAKSGLHCIKGSDGKYNCDFGYEFKDSAFGGSGIDC